MSENVTLQKYLSRLTPHCRELFRMAHAITENAELAEYALLSAMRSAYLSLGDDVPFRDSIRHAVVEQSLGQLPRRDREEYPPDFRCFELPGDNGEVGAWLAAEKPETRRLLLLRYGCGLGSGDAGRALGVSRQAARAMMAAAQANFSRALGNLPFDKTMARAARRELSRTDTAAPDMGALLRTFEADLRGAEKPRFSVRKGVRALFCGLCVLILAFAFWLFAAITAAPTPESVATPPAEYVEELT